MPVYQVNLRILVNLKINLKSQWLILKKFLSNKQEPCIPPLFHQHIVIPILKEKLDY